jgi:methyl-accepting chemotaxis protein
MVALFKKSLKVRILSVLIFTIIISLTGLSLIIVNVQTSLLDDMGVKIDLKLQQTGNDSAKDFAVLELEVEKSLMDLGEIAAATVSAKTEKALSNEENILEKQMDAMLINRAKAICALLDKVAAPLIEMQQEVQLAKYSEAAAGTDEIVYTLFFDKEKKALPGYVDLANTYNMKWIKAGQNKDINTRIVNQSKKESGILVYEQEVKYFGSPVGTMVIGMDKASVKNEIKKLSNRFNLLRQGNSKAIKTELNTGVKGVIVEMKDDLKKVMNNNKIAARETGVLLKESSKKASSRVKNIIAIVGIFCCLIIFIFIALFMRYIIIIPIQNVTAGLKDAAQGDGDLTKRLEISREDEIGRLAGWFDAFLERLNNIIVDIRKSSVAVLSSSDDVLMTSQEMSKSGDELSGKAGMVAAASEEMSSNMDSVAAASEEISANMSMVSDAANQMKKALDDVTGKCDKAKQTSGKASIQVTTAIDRVGKLGNAAKEINKVTEAITDIAEQTNLLALNATIEAARAGDAGRGFAVVASEIKTLALETQKATQDIKERVSEIQTTTDDTTMEVGNISQVIMDTGEIVGVIATAMQEQSAATIEVAENIEHASSGLAEVNENVSQASKVSSEIAVDIEEVNNISSAISEKSTTLQQNSAELSNLSSHLRDLIGIFKTAS